MAFFLCPKNKLLDDNNKQKIMEWKVFPYPLPESRQCVVSFVVRYFSGLGAVSAWYLFGITPDKYRTNTEQVPNK